MLFKIFDSREDQRIDRDEMTKILQSIYTVMNEKPEVLSAVSTPCSPSGSPTGSPVGSPSAPRPRMVTRTASNSNFNFIQKFFTHDKPELEERTLRRSASQIYSPKGIIERPSTHVKAGLITFRCRRCSSPEVACSWDSNEARIWAYLLQ